MSICASSPSTGTDIINTGGHKARQCRRTLHQHGQGLCAVGSNGRSTLVFDDAVAVAEFDQ